MPQYMIGKKEIELDHKVIFYSVDVFELKKASIQLNLNHNRKAPLRCIMYTKLDKPTKLQ